MGFFDRFMSKKGQDQTTGPKRGVVKKTPDKNQAAEKKSFAAVPSAVGEKPGPKKKSDQPVAPSVKSSSTVNHLAHRVLIRPIVTEKSTRGAAQSQYTFAVSALASKTDVHRAIHHLYGVTPVAVNIMTQRSQTVRFGRNYGQTAKWKKAVVTLPPGKKIDAVNA